MKNLLSICLNNLLVYYQYLVKSEIENNEKLYNRCIEKIKFYSMVIERLKEREDFNKMVRFTRILLFAKKETKKPLNDEEELKRDFTNLRLNNYQTKVTFLDDIFFKDFIKDILISLRGKIEKESDLEKKKKLLEIYYFFIYGNPHLEQELLYNPLLLNVPSNSFRRYLKSKNKDIQEFILDFLYESTLRFIIISEKGLDSVETLVFECCFEAYLSRLNKQNVYQFKEFCLECLDEARDEKSILFLIDLVDNRLKENGVSKIFSIIP